MSVLFISGLVLSVAVGLLLGLVGGGGSILTVPILVYFFEVPPLHSIGMSLVVVSATSLLATCRHYQCGNVDTRSGLLFGSSGILGAIMGSPLTQLVSPEALLFVFGVLMCSVAVSMIFFRRKIADEEPKVSHPLLALIVGFCVGILTGFLGVGGGFLIVPALVYFGGLTMKRAIGTSLIVIFLNCTAGLISHATQHVFDWSLLGLVTILSVGGAIYGSTLSSRFETRHLQQVFALLVLAVGGFLIVKNVDALSIIS